MNPKILSSIPSLAFTALACAILAAPAARAQTVSSVNASASGSTGSSGTAPGTTNGTTTAPTGTRKVAASSTASSPATAAAVASPTPATSIANETVTFSGPIAVTATVVPDTAGGPATTVVFFDATQVTGTGSSGTLYTNTGQANLTRVFAASDNIQTTISFQPETADGYLRPRTALVTLNLTFDPATNTLTSANAKIGSFTPVQ